MKYYEKTTDPDGNEHTTVIDKPISPIALAFNTVVLSMAAVYAVKSAVTIYHIIKDEL